MAHQDNTFGEIIKWGAIAAGAYLLWQYFMGSSAAPATGTPVTTAPAVPAPVANETATASALIGAAGGVNSLNVDQWNYYTYQLGWTVLTPAQSAAVAAAAGGDSPMSVDAYLAARTAAGIANTSTAPAPSATAPATPPAVVTYLAANPYTPGSPQWTAYNAQAPVGVSGLGAAPLPVPLIFAYGAGGRPVLLVPGSGRAA